MRILQILRNYSTYREIPTVALLPRNDMVVGSRQRGFYIPLDQVGRRGHDPALQGDRANLVS